jgi:hypothetical protein
MSPETAAQSARKPRSGDLAKPAEQSPNREGHSGSKQGMERGQLTTADITRMACNSNEAQ